MERSISVAAETTLKDPRKEIGPGLLRKMLTDLGLSRRDLEDR